jgi:exosortase
VTQDYHTTPPSNVHPALLVHLFYLAFWLLTIGTFWGPLRQLLSLSLNDDRYSHLIVIPLISACLIYGKRRDIFHATTYELRIGIPLVLVAVGAGWWFSLRLLSARNDYGLSFVILVVLFAWVAGFLLCHGVRALRPARFPLLFLLLMIPIPQVLMEKVILVLQVGTSDLIYALFRLAGTPLFRHGFTFELPGVGIVIAEESSSIHSAWALFITGLLVGHFFLRSFPAKACLSLLTIPIAILTNAMRIVTIWFLATRVNIDFMQGNLHRHGGILFSFISLFMLLFSLWMLRKLEHRAGRARRYNDFAVDRAHR